MATPTSGDSASTTGLVTTYSTVTSPTGGAGIAVLDVARPGWYDVSVWAWNTGTTGVVGTDDLNLGLYSDEATADTLVFQGIIPWNPFLIAAATPPPVVPVRFKVHAQGVISVKAMAAATTGAKYVVQSACRLARYGDTEYV